MGEHRRAAGPYVPLYCPGCKERWHDYEDKPGGETKIICRCCKRTFIVQIVAAGLTLREERAKARPPTVLLDGGPARW